jgi:hypothetical protein
MAMRRGSFSGSITNLQQDCPQMTTIQRWQGLGHHHAGTIFALASSI